MPGKITIRASREGKKSNLIAERSFVCDEVTTLTIGPLNSGADLEVTGLELQGPCTVVRNVRNYHGGDGEVSYSSLLMVPPNLHSAVHASGCTITDDAGVPRTGLVEFKSVDNVRELPFDGARAAMFLCGDIIVGAYLTSPA